MEILQTSALPLGHAAIECNLTYPRRHWVSRATLARGAQLDTVPWSEYTEGDAMNDGIKKSLRKVLPWMVALGLMGYLFYKIPLDSLVQELRQINWPMLLAVVVFVDLGSWLTDSFAASRVFSWFLTPVSMKEILPVRAATYLMAILNYNLGQAGLIYYIHRAKNVPVADVTGLVLMMMGTVVLVLSGMSVVGMLLGLDEQARNFGMMLMALGGGAVVYFVLLRIRPAFLARRAFFRILFKAGVLGHLRATVVRLPHMIVLVVTHFMALRTFDIEVPLGSGLILIPSVLLVASVPVAPFGLGTMQATSVAFFSRYAPGATAAARQAKVLAYSLSLASLTLSLQALLGLVFLRMVADMIAVPKDPTEE